MVKKVSGYKPASNPILLFSFVRSPAEFVDPGEGGVGGGGSALIGGGSSFLS